VALSSAADVAKLCSNVSTAIERGQKETLLRAAQTAKTTILAGAPARLRNVGRAGAKLGAGYDFSGTNTVKVRSRGPWPLVEVSSKAHQIKPRRSRGKSAVHTPAGPRRRVMHPGTRAKHLWTKGVDKAEPLVAKEMGRQTLATVGKAFTSG
jgi:hypothetical protein